MKKGRCISKVLGVKVDRILMPQVLEKLDIWLSSRGKRWVVTPNPEMIILAQKDNHFRKILNQADLSLADGIGLRWADKRIKARVSGSEVMIKLIEQASKKGWRVFLLGGRDKIAERAAEKLRQKYQDLEIKGFSGPASLEQASKAEKIEMLQKINQFKPHLLLVGFGQGRQEKWIVANLDKLRVRVAMGVGGAIDQVVKPWLRAPRLMKLMGLEWCWRLLIQPWRIKRQLRLIEFVFRLLKD